MVDVTNLTDKHVEKLTELRYVIALTNERKIKNHDDGMLLPYCFILYIIFDAKLLRWIDKNTTGRFYRGSSSIMFEEDKDAMMFKLGVKNEPQQSR